MTGMPSHLKKIPHNESAPSYLLVNMGHISGRFELAPGVTLVGLPSGLGQVATPTSHHALLYRKTRQQNNAMMIQFGLLYGGRIKAELLVTPEAHRQFRNREEAVLAMKMLLQCSGWTNVEVPVALSVPLSGLAAAGDGSVELKSIDQLMGFQRYRFDERTVDEVVERAQRDWPTFMKFFHGEEAERFRLALLAVEASRYAHNIRFSLAELWIAPEAVFGTSGGETTFKITSAWATADAPPGAARRKLQRDLKKLYDVRSRAVHGDLRDPREFERCYVETYLLFMRCVQRFLDRRVFPKPNELLDAIFGDAAVDS